MPRVVLVTGAARRIGRAIALHLGAGGFDVAVHYRASAAEAEAVADEIRAAGGRAATFACDLADAGALPTLLDRAAGALGPVTDLVNNASLFEPDDIASVTAATWDAHLNVNLRAPVLLARHFADALPAGTAGAIVNIVDQRVLKPVPHFLSYGIAKAALWQATRILAQGLAPRIRVNAVAPGPTLPNIRQTPEDFRRQQQAVLLGRGPDVREVAEAVRYFLDSPSVTGQMLVVDGGQHLGWETPDVKDIPE